ncbi:hypothetical protein SeLEV6574_g03721 [Synchytrium endobioticum]|uniref:Uncharacterized protein n=1 Tax=Synchytrium endobioticum TaxID=286115 RepID=A0A507D2V8_9FUNG|nr:hypothetical protein SeLEV6574_g03721 [Synchytrium endobioticum]
MASSRPRHIDLTKFPLKQVAPVSLDSSRPIRTTHAPPKSQALACELALHELFAKHPLPPSRDRIRGVFRVLDDLATTDALKIIRDEFKAAVYAPHLLTSADAAQDQVEAIPYFEAFKRADEIRTTDLGEAGSTISDLRTKLAYRERDMQNVYRKNVQLKQELLVKERENAALNARVDNLMAQLKETELRMTEEQDALQKTTNELANKVDTLQTALMQANVMIEKLSVLKSANMGDDSDDVQNQSNLSEFNLGPSALTEYDLRETLRIELQMSQVLDGQLDDFDAALAQYKKKAELLMNSAMGDAAESAIRETALRGELRDLNFAFADRMKKFLEEQDLLLKHMNGLKVTQLMYAKAKKDVHVERLADLALRKYATTIAVSTDHGRTYHVPDTLVFCTKCGAKTLLCPHRTLRKEVLELGNDVTHLRFNHPPLRIRTRLTASSNQAPEEQRRRWLNEILGQKKADKDDGNDSDAGSTDSESSKEDDEISPSIKRVWKDYYEVHHGEKPPRAREITVEKLTTLIEEIYAARWTAEEALESATSERERIGSISEYFYQFMTCRYMVPQVAMKAIYDVLHSLQTHEHAHPTITLFIRNLGGEDDVTWKYIEFVRRFVASRPTLDSYRYQQFLRIMYPARKQSTYDHMSLEMIAYSQNRLTVDSIEAYITKQILEDTEPNFAYEAVRQLLPRIPPGFIPLRFRLADGATSDQNVEDVPIPRLAKTMAYAYMYLASQQEWTAPDIGSIGVDFDDDDDMSVVKEDESVRQNLLANGNTPSARPNVIPNATSQRASALDDEGPQPVLHQKDAAGVTKLELPKFKFVPRS